MMMMQDAIPPIRSPMPGIKPTMPSRPKRIDVPGILMKSSSTCDSRSRLSSSNALLARFRRGDRISGFAVNAIGPPLSPWYIVWRGASAIIPVYGGYSSVAERRSVAADVVGSKPTSRPKILSSTCTVRSQLPRMPKAPLRIVLAEPSTRLHAGTSGWAYPTWKPDFYPAGTPAKRFLEFYATQLNSVEVNYTFRALPTAKILDGWLSATPANFRFSFKAPQRITHFKRLRECDDDMAQFVAALNPVRQTGKLGLL